MNKMANISVSCEDIKVNELYEYLLPATSGINRSHPDCDASWNIGSKNGIAIATTRPYLDVTDPAIRVEDDRLMANRCLRSLYYHMECISGASEEFLFQSSNSDPPDLSAHNNAEGVTVLLLGRSTLKCRQFSQRESVDTESLKTFGHAMKWTPESYGC